MHNSILRRVMGFLRRVGEHKSENQADTDPLPHRHILIHTKDASVPVSDWVPVRPVTQSDWVPVGPVTQSDWISLTWKYINSFYLSKVVEHFYHK